MLVALPHVAAYIAMFQSGLPDNLRTPAMPLAYGILPLCYLVVPVVGGLSLVERVRGIFNASLLIA